MVLVMLNKSILSKPINSADPALLDFIKSITASGDHKVTNIKMDIDEKIVIQYESAAHA